MGRELRGEYGSEKETHLFRGCSDLFAGLFEIAHAHLENLNKVYVLFPVFTVTVIVTQYSRGK